MKSKQRKSAILKIQLLDIPLTRKKGPIHAGFTPYFRRRGASGQGVYSATFWKLDSSGERLWEWKLGPGESAIFGATFTCDEFAAQLEVGMLLEMCTPTPIAEAAVLEIGSDIDQAFLSWSSRAAN